ncbi:MAG TPA: hypothetical protein VFF73_10135 [Planctomycetota bacterium]|nr:hypothetical protein [Planctomycetota bacterium]
MPRPVAPGLIQGAFRGLIAGLFVAFLLLAFLAAGQFLRREPILVFALGVPIFAATLGAADGIEARIERKDLGWFVRFLAPPVGATLATMTVLTIDDRASGNPILLPSATTARVIAWAAALSLGLSVGLLVAGPHDPRENGIRRALVAASFSVSPAVVLIPSREAIGVLLMLLVVANLLGFVFHVGHAIARPLGHQIGSWLEPDESFSALEERTDAYKTHVLTWAAAAAQAGRTGLDRERRALLEQALEAARAAHELAFADPRLGRFQTEAAERLALAEAAARA